MERNSEELYLECMHLALGQSIALSNINPIGRLHDRSVSGLRSLSILSSDQLSKYSPLQNLLHPLRTQLFFHSLSHKDPLATTLANHSSSTLNSLNLAATRSSTAFTKAGLVSFHTLEFISYDYSSFLSRDRLGWTPLRRGTRFGSFAIVCVNSFNLP